MIGGWLRDLKHGWQMLRRQPGTAIVVALVLGLGIGVNTTVFTVANALFFRDPSGVTQPDRLVRIQARLDRPPGPQGSREYSSVGYPQYTYLRERATVFSDVAAYSYTAGIMLRRGNLTEQAVATFVTGNFFPMLGVRPGLGRWIQPSDDREGAEPVVVLGHGYWQRAMGSDASVIGSTVALYGRPFTVIGVAPPEFEALSYDDAVSDIWLPVWTRMPLLGRPRSDMVRTPGQVHTFLTVIARLKHDVSAAEAEAVVTAIGQQLAIDFPNEEGRTRLATLAHVSGNPNRRVVVVSLLRVLAGVAFIVLVIACANLANLLLVRASARTREVGVRLSLGATRFQLVRQFLSETLVLAVAGGIVGVLISLWSASLLAQRLPIPPSIASSTPPAIDLRVLGFAALVALVSAFGFGLAPAFHAARMNVTDVLRSGTRVAAASSRTRAALLAGQFALTLMLLVGASLLVQNLRHMRNIPIGYQIGNNLSAAINLRPHGYDNAGAALFYARLLERVQSLPGVSMAALTNAVPLTGALSAGTIEIEGVPSQGEPPPVYKGIITPGYFTTFGLTVRTGRDFTAADRQGSDRVAIVNEAFVRRFWPGQDAIGKRITESESWTVVGVVADARLYSIFDPAEPMIFQPMLQKPALALELQIATPGDPRALIPTIRQEVAALDANVGVHSFDTLEYRYELSFRRFARNALLIGVLGALALFLAALGLYATVSHSVAQRTREIGVRMAVGARSRDVLRLMFKNTLAIAAIGLLLGSALSLTATRVIRHWLYELSPFEPAAFLSAAGILVATVFLAAWLPARRATRVDPLVALRED